MTTLEQVGIIPNGTTVFLVTGTSVDREVAMLKGAIVGVASNPLMDPNSLQYDAVFNASWGMTAADHSIVIRDKNSVAWLRLGESDLDGASGWLLNVIATEVVRKVNFVRGGGADADVVA